MDSLVHFIFRIKADISGSIREPVTVHFLSCKLLYKRNDLCIDHIMHITCNRNCHSGKGTCHCRKSLFETIIFLSKTVFYHLTYKGKGQDKSKPCHKSPHKVICQLHLCSGKSGKKYCKILSTIIIIDFSTGIPEICSRKSFTSHHGFHKSIIHKFFCAIGSRMESCQICPEKEQCKKQKFFSIDQSQMIYRQTLESLFPFSLIKNKSQHTTGYCYTNTGSRSKRKDPCCYQKPSDKTGYCYGQNLGKYPAFIIKSAEHSSCYRHSQKSQDCCQEIPGPERPCISLQKNSGQCHQKHRRYYLYDIHYYFIGFHIF